MPSPRTYPTSAPISGPYVSRWERARRVAAAVGHFLVGVVPGFLGGLMTGSIAVAAAIGLTTGLIWLLLKLRFGDRLDSSMNRSPEQVALQARARAHGYMGPGVG